MAQELDKERLLKAIVANAVDTVAGGRDMEYVASALGLNARQAELALVIVEDVRERNDWEYGS